MSDLISRQAAIDVVKRLMGDYELSRTVQTGLHILSSAQSDRSLWFRIGEICVDESKGFISPGRAVEKIRELLREAERREE